VEPPVEEPPPVPVGWGGFGVGCGEGHAQSKVDVRIENANLFIQYLGYLKAYPLIYPDQPTLFCVLG
jgi:hypothetical protein